MASTRKNLEQTQTRTHPSRRQQSRATWAWGSAQGAEKNGLRRDLRLTSDADLGRPLGRAVQHALLDRLHLLRVCGLGHSEDFLDELEDLGLVALPDLHAVFEHHDDVLRPVLCPVLGALLSGPCR